MYENNQTIQTLMQIINTPIIDAETRKEAQKKLMELVKTVKIYK